MRFVSILAFVGLVSGCSDNGDAGMFVLNNSAPPAGTVCTFTGEQAQLFTSAGTISWYATELGQGYVLSPLVESRIATTSASQVAQRTIHLEGANITAQVNGTGAKRQYTVLFAGSLVPGGTTNVSFEALPVASIVAFDPVGDQNVLVVLTIQIYGSFGGSRIDADQFVYPVTIVGKEKGVAFGTSTTSVTSCKTSTSVARTGNACNPLQDGVVDCCREQVGAMPMGSDPLVCPAVPQN